MCPVAWVEGTPSSGGSKFPFLSIQRQTWLMVLGDLVTLQVHWVNEFQRTVPHLVGERCIQCERGLPKRLAGYLGAQYFVSKGEPWKPVIWHIPGDCLPMLGEGPHRGLRFEARRNPPKSHTALTIVRSEQDRCEPDHPPIDVRTHLLRFWQLDDPKPKALAPSHGELDAAIVPMQSVANPDVLQMPLPAPKLTREEYERIAAERGYPVRKTGGA